MITVAVSGGFDPIHVGHIRLLEAAAELGDQLVVILNNDNWLKNKKGYAFMKEQERKEILLSIGCVDSVVITNHKENDEDISVCNELRQIDPHILANGGDRFADNIPEMGVCEELDITPIFNVGGEKINSSSKLVETMKLKKEVQNARK